MSDITRPGLTPVELAAAKIRRIAGEEAHELVGLASPGIYIPYFNSDGAPMLEGGFPYGRLRLDEPIGKRKYHQKAEGTQHIYLTATSCMKGPLILVEGEFKALALARAGLRAVGISGFYGWKVKGQECLIMSLQDFLVRYPAPEVWFQGDSDTSFNRDFSDATVRLAQVTKNTIVLPRMPLVGGKGVDDVLQELGLAPFKKWYSKLPKVQVSPKDQWSDVFLTLASATLPEISRLDSETLDKYAKRFAQAGERFGPASIKRLSDLAKSLFGFSKAEFNALVRDSDCIEDDHTWDKAVFDEIIQTRKTYLSRVNGLFDEVSLMGVELRLQKAGFRRGVQTTEAVPVLGKQDGLCELSAALHHLELQRVSRVDLIFFRPYGRIEVNGDTVYNQARAVALKPAVGEPVRSWDDPRIRLTAIWLKLLFGEAQLRHCTTAIAYPYRYALKGQAMKPLMLMLIGRHGAGKGLFTDWWIPHLFGQTKSGDATRLLKGENGGAPSLLWYVNRVSDKSVASEYEASLIQGSLLSLLAEYGTGARWLYNDQVELDITNLFCFSANPQATLLNILKGPGAAQLFNRAGIYCCGKGLVEMKDRMANELDPEFFLFPSHFLEKELPFVANLLVNWECPEYEDLARYGCKPYCQPNALKMIQLSPVANTVRQVLIDCIPFKVELKGTAAKIYGILNSRILDIPAMRSIRDLKDFRAALEELEVVEKETGGVTKKTYEDSDGNTNSVLWEIVPEKINSGFPETQDGGNDTCVGT